MCQALGRIANMEKLKQSPDVPDKKPAVTGGDPAMKTPPFLSQVSPAHILGLRHKVFIPMVQNTSLHILPQHRL